MLDPDFIKYLSSLGVGGLIAGLMFMWYRRDVKTFTEQWKGQTELLMTVVRDNTAAMSTNNEMIRALTRHLDQQDDDARRRR